MTRSNILIIDPDEGSRWHAKASLLGAGFRRAEWHFPETISCEYGLRIIQSGEHDIRAAITHLCTDIGSRMMGGAEFLRAVRTYPQFIRLPIVIYTAAQRELYGEIPLDRFSAWVDKGGDTFALARKMRELMELAEAV